jgi:hypothetical protein
LKHLPEAPRDKEESKTSTTSIIPSTTLFLKPSGLKVEEIWDQGTRSKIAPEVIKFLQKLLDDLVTIQTENAMGGLGTMPEGAEPYVREIFKVREDLLKKVLIKSPSK